MKIGRRVELMGASSNAGRMIVGDQRSAEGLVVSDLHLFARRSAGQGLFARLQRSVLGIEWLVFNGDTFDFRWSTFTGHEPTRRAAVRWLEEVLEALPKTDIYFVVGNHDCLLPFLDDLRGLASRESRFRWEPYHLWIGDRLFLHGDCVHSRMGLQELAEYRRVWGEDRQRGALGAWFYGVSDRLGLTAGAHAWHFRREATIDRLIYYLDAAVPEWSVRARSCFFGHTHRPILGYERHGILFHNTGSGIRHMRFNPLLVDGNHTWPAGG